jgi:hypothetical protein
VAADGMLWVLPMSLEVQFVRQVRKDNGPALEYGGTPDGRELLQALAQKEPETPRGLAAKAALTP